MNYKELNDMYWKEINDKIDLIENMTYEEVLKEIEIKKKELSAWEDKRMEMEKIENKTGKKYGMQLQIILVNMGK